jgi:hypothetical protein
LIPALGIHFNNFTVSTSVHVIEDKDGKCFRDFPLSEEWTTIFEGVELRLRYPDPKDRNSWDLRVRRDVASIYVHIPSLEESWCDDAGFGDESRRSSNWLSSIKLDVGAPCDSEG